MNSEVESRLSFLRREIERHNRLYFDDAAPEISDREFDKLVDECIALGGPQDAVSEPMKSTTARTLGSALHLSTQKVYGEDELRKFDQAVKKRLKIGYNPEYVLEEKIDGAAVSLRYQNGILVSGSTRGGNDITAHCFAMPAVPKELLPFKGNQLEVLEVRGRIYAHYDDIEKVRLPTDPTTFSISLSSDGSVTAGERFYNGPREMAVGSLQTMDSEVVGSRPLHLFVNEVGETETDVPWTYGELLKMFSEVGLPVNPSWRFCRSIDEVIEKMPSVMLATKTAAYPVAGIDVMVDCLDWWPKLGTTAKYPKWMVTYLGSGD
ncbi:MAG: hypothetical protein ACR2IE_16905 [Candidatus Sumerlaeaceae bacterium]